LFLTSGEFAQLRSYDETLLDTTAFSYDRGLSLICGHSLLVHTRDGAAIPIPYSVLVPHKRDVQRFRSLYTVDKLLLAEVRGRRKPTTFPTVPHLPPPGVRSAAYLAGRAQPYRTQRTIHHVHAL
jgi:hypothetical protein